MLMIQNKPLNCKFEILVTHAGFEPAVYRMRTYCPRPLDECVFLFAFPVKIYYYFNIPSEKYPIFI